MRRQGNGHALGSRTLWLTAAVFAATWAPQPQASEVGRTPGTLTRLAQATTAPPKPHAAEGQDHPSAETLARELAVTKGDLDVLLRLLNRACAGSIHTGQAADREAADLRKALWEEHNRAEGLKRDLAAVHDDAQAQCAPANKAGGEVIPSKLAADEVTADLARSLQQEHDRASRLEQDLAASRRDLEMQTALAAKAQTEASQLKNTADAGSADLRKSLQQEHDRASRLEQDLAASRRDVETQTALATKAAAEAGELKKTADTGSADLRQSLQQEQQRASRLEQDLAASRREVETQAALATKASTDASEQKKTAEAGAADLRKSLQQEQQRARRLGQDLKAARRKFEKQIALSANAAAEASQFKKTADAGAADLRKSLQQERDRASLLEQDLATARRDVETQTALATKASTDASQQKKAADAGAADLHKSLQQEHDRASRLEQDLAAARREVEMQTALAAKTSGDASPVKRAPDADAADLRKSLQQERDRAIRLEQDLAAARNEVETQTTLASKASDDASQAKKAADAGSADLRNLLQQEHDRASLLEQELAAAKRDVETQTTLASKSSEEASQAKKTADAGAADLRKSLQQEHERASRLEQELAATKRDVETQTALATKASDAANQLKKADANSAELRKSLQQERNRAAQLERDLALARSNALAPSDTQQQEKAATPVAPKPMAVPDTPPKPEKDAAEIARLVAYARVLLARGDIGSARIVLQRAVDMGSAEASFTLAESYDPLILSKWGTFGTHGDANKALDLYARALAAGINEAKERSEALHR